MKLVGLVFLYSLNLYALTSDECPPGSELIQSKIGGSTYCGYYRDARRIRTIRHGPHEMLNSRGVLIVRSHYENNIKNGEYKSFRDDGSLLTEGQYKNGKREGEFTNYGSNGSVVSKHIYKNDKIVRRDLIGRGSRKKAASKSAFQEKENVSISCSLESNIAEASIDFLKLRAHDPFAAEVMKRTFDYQNNSKVRFELVKGKNNLTAVRNFKFEVIDLKEAVDEELIATLIGKENVGPGSVQKFLKLKSFKSAERNFKKTIQTWHNAFKTQISAIVLKESLLKYKPKEYQKLKFMGALLSFDSSYLRLEIPGASANIKNVIKQNVEKYSVIGKYEVLEEVNNGKKVNYYVRLSGCKKGFL